MQADVPPSTAAGVQALQGACATGYWDMWLHSLGGFPRVQARQCGVHTANHLGCICSTLERKGREEEGMAAQTFLWPPGHTGLSCLAVALFFRCLPKASTYPSTQAIAL